MSLTLGTIATSYGCELRGDPDAEVDRVGTLDEATAGSIAFFANRRYLTSLRATKATAVLLQEDAADDCPVAALVCPDPYLIFTHVVRTLNPVPAPVPGIASGAAVAEDATVPATCQIAANAVIEPGARLGERVFVGPNAVIGRNTIIGDDTRLLAGCIVCDGVAIGARCLIHPGAVIGSDGFGNARNSDGSWLKIPQIGGVRVGDDVEIGANTTIDRGAIDDTIIGNGVRIDNLVQIAHNVIIGDHTAVAALVGMSGSTRIGARCMIGGQSGFAGHLEVGNDVVIAAGTGVHNSLTGPAMYAGASNPAQPARGWRRNVMRIVQLDRMAKRLAALEKAARRGQADD